MSVFAELGAYNREDDWFISLASLLVTFVLIYPLFILYIRYKHMYRIKKQLVTSMYSLPISMTPVELAYIYSTKVKHQQLYATLLHMANKSIILMHRNNGKTTVETGPKVSSDLASYEQLLFERFNEKKEPTDINKVITGYTNYNGENKANKITGSRQYVFWWLLRDTLRARKIIEKHLSKKFAVMLFVYGVMASFVISVVSVASVRFIQMAAGGEIDLDRVVQSIGSGVSLWLLMLLPMVIISFGVLKYKGRMLGRDWIMTEKYRRYLGQMDAFREFVRLTHKDKLRFESKELKKESKAHTLPYAIACGYIKK
jgi:hypothetical protein